MSQDDAVIRPYVHDEDNKLVRFIVAKTAMEPLAAANRKAIAHPLTVSLWIGLSSIFIHVLDWWPDARFGMWGYLRPLPAFAALSLPLIFFIDWYQRPQFEKYSMDALKRPDIATVEQYYIRNPSSGLWIYEFGKKFVGLLAVDTSIDSLWDETIFAPSQIARDPNMSKIKTKTKARRLETATTAVIRHLYVVEPYRVANAQDDLIAFAAKHVFETSSDVSRIRMTPSPLSEYLGRSLRSRGFDVVEQGAKIGILGWTTLSYELTREKWEALQAHNMH